MAAHCGGGGVRITRFDRSDDGFMFLKRGRHPIARAQLQATVGLQPFLQPINLAVQKAVAADAADGCVKFFIGVVICITVARACGLRAGAVQRCQLLHIQSRGAAGAVAGTKRFKFGNNFKHFAKFLRPHLGCKSAAARDMFDKPCGCQLKQRLPDRGARDVEFMRKGGFVQPLAGADHAGQNAVFKGVAQASFRFFHDRFVSCPLCLSQDLRYQKEILVYNLFALEHMQCYRFRGAGISGGEHRLSFCSWEGTTMKFSSLAIAVAVSSSLLSSAAFSETLKLSHQWSEGDVRHQVAQMVADDVAAAGVDLQIQIFPNQTLFKAREQYTPLSRGQLDMTVLPLSYAGGQQPAYNLTLMPGLVKNHDHGNRLSHSPFMDEVQKIMAGDDVITLVHGYLAGGFGSNKGCITKPADVAGISIRAAGKSFEQMLAGAGASISSMASSEIYPALQTGVLDATNTSSESFVSYRLYEQLKCYTPAGEYALWFMYQPMLMNKTTFEALNQAQQDALMAASAKAEAFYLEQAKLGDEVAAKAFSDAGVELAQMTEADFNAWRDLAKTTSYPAFVAETPDGQRLLDLALSVE